MKPKKILTKIAKNKLLHVFLGLMTVYAGVSETYETLADDLLSANIKAAHGVICVGLLHLLRSISEFIEAADYLNESIK
ncbi:hypothetical protein N9E54_02980 [Alphaproteobacteria bacterium]|nr:hypothetical protein [Alphaproteobacteria bacterium]